MENVKRPDKYAIRMAGDGVDGGESREGNSVTQWCRVTENMEGAKGNTTFVFSIGLRFRLLALTLFTWTVDLWWPRS